MDLKKELKKELYLRELARRKYFQFVQYTFSKYQMTQFHLVVSSILQYFIESKIRKLIISIPPQHGKTELSTRRLVPFLFGLDPTLKIAVTSYSIDRSRRFGRDIKRIMTSPEYQVLFDKTKLPEARDTKYTNAAEVVDIIGGDIVGNLFFTGRGGGLTGEQLDVLIMDDLYKNSSEAYSPVVRQNIIDWYNSVAESRLHNDSKQLIVFTRWHDQDLAGYICKNEEVELLEKIEQLENADIDKWYMINFEALKKSNKTQFDMREFGEPLFPGKHSRKKLETTRDRIIKTSPESWNSLYMGDPRPVSGLLYGTGFHEYMKLPDLTGRRCYIDTADQGKDWLCAIAYGIGVDNYIYILDIYYTIESQEITERETALFIKRNNLDESIIESNAGGRTFARNVGKILREIGCTTEIKPFYQSTNKESRIITHASMVLRIILMPQNWIGKWPQFAENLLGFRRFFKANENDDTADTITGVIEHSGLDSDIDDIAVGVV